MDEKRHLPLTPLSFQIVIALADQPRHGYGIVKEIEHTTGAPMKSSTGTLYLAIERLEQAGLLEPAPGNDGRRRYYQLTSLGRDVATAETERLATLVGIARAKKLVEAREVAGWIKEPGKRRR